MGEKNPELPVQTGAVDTHCHLFLMEEEPALAVEAASGRRRRAADLRRGRRREQPPLARAGRCVARRVRHGGRPSPRRGRRSTPRPPPRSRSCSTTRGWSRVGECGLDYFRMHSPVEDQRRTLATHVAMSNASGKPMVVHVRDAWDDTLDLLEAEGAERVVIHCFSGDAQIAKECAARGYWLSFAGNVTYPKNEHLRQAARAVAVRSAARRDRRAVPRAADRSAAATTCRRTCSSRSPSSRACATTTRRRDGRDHRRRTRSRRSRGSIATGCPPNARSVSRLQ